MARRSDHSREELEAMMIAAAHAHMAEVGYARFSGREVAKRVGYSIGTLYNVFGSLNLLLLAVNARTLAMWTEAAEAALAQAGEGERVDALVRTYFAFAGGHRNAWSAIYDHRSPEAEPLPDWYAAALGQLLALMVREVERALPEAARGEAPALAHSLLSSVHGHCVFALDGTFTLLGQDGALELAIARVREAIAVRALSSAHPE